MKDTLSENEAVSRLLDDGNAGWTLQGARALIENLMQYEEDTGQELEFDPVAFRCEYAEYESYWDAAEDWGIKDEDEDPEQYFRENTHIIEFSGGVIIQTF